MNMTTRCAMLGLAVMAFTFGTSSMDAQETAGLLTPPVTPAEPKALEAHGERRIDHYDWLSNPEKPDVSAHLQAENAYTEARLAPLRPLIGEISAELRGRNLADQRSQRRQARFRI